MYFRSIVEHSGMNVYRFTIDAHSEAGYRGDIAPVVGQPITAGANIHAYPANIAVLSEDRLKQFITDAAASLG